MKKIVRTGCDKQEDENVWIDVYGIGQMSTYFRSGKWMLIATMKQVIARMELGERKNNLTISVELSKI